MKRGHSPLRAALALCVALAWATLAPDALAVSYSVAVNPTLNGLDIKVEPIAQEGMLFVKLTNQTDSKVRCDLEYEAGPQLPYRTSEFVQPGKDATSVFKATRKWHAVAVDVKCVKA